MHQRIERMRVTSWTLGNCSGHVKCNSWRLHNINLLQFVRFRLKITSNVSIEQFETFVNYLMRWFECNYLVLFAQTVSSTIYSSAPAHLHVWIALLCWSGATESIAFTLSCSNFRWHRTVIRKLHFLLTQCTSKLEFHQFTFPYFFFPLFLSRMSQKPELKLMLIDYRNI